MFHSKKGENIGELKTAVKFVKNGDITISVAAKRLGISEEEMAKAVETYADEE